MCVCVLCVPCVAALLGMFCRRDPKRRGQGVREWRFVRVMRASSSSSGIWGDGFQAMQQNETALASRAGDGRQELESQKKKTQHL